METTNHECYVSLELAKLLEKAGFDWKCKYAYIITPVGDMPSGKEGMLIEYVENVNWLVKAPTLEVAQRWLREVKNTHIEVSPDSTMSTYIYNILLSWDKFWLGSPISYSTYEEAQEAGIKEALELILEKGE